MLVFTRKKGDTFQVTGPATIHILEARHGGRVKVGIEAPPSTTVTRGEIVTQFVTESPHPTRRHQPCRRSTATSAKR